MNENQVALPRHVGLIMRGGFAGEKKAIRTSFYDEFQADIPGKHEVVVKRIALFEENGTNDIDSYQFIWRKPAPLNMLSGLNFTKSK